MRTSTSWIWLLVSGCAAWGQNSYYLPVAADGASADGGTVRTSILIGNPGVRAAKVGIAWTNDDGSARQVTLGDLGSDSKFSISLAPGATRIFQTAGSGSDSSGAAIVSSDQVVNVWEVQSAFDGSGTLRRETGIAAAGTSTGFRIPVDSASGVALYNPTSVDASITASLTDASGAVIGSQTFTLAAGSRVTRMVSGDLFDTLLSLSTLDVTSTAPLAAESVRASGAVLDAAPLTSKRMKFYYPRLADGPSIGATLRTTFLLTNLSKKPASVTIVMTREDGSPWTVAIPGIDANSRVVTIVAPGTSTVLQTDGAGVYATGAAAIQSDGPIGVQALVSAFDSQGALLSETAVPDARLRQQFTLPFDITADLNPGAVFYNPGTQPVAVTLSLIDADGKVAATTQAGPVPAGGQVAGAVTDFFSGTSVLRGALSVSTGGAFVSALALRQSQSLPWSSTLPALAIPLNGVPISVTTTVDDKRAVTASIGPKGGSLTLTDASGNKFTLTIPANAVLATEKIVMTPVTAAKGVPGSGLVSVQLAPDGLALLQPATLAIQPASGSGATLTPIGWFGSSSPGVYLNLPQPQASQFTMLLTHFSNAGGANLAPGDLTSVLLNIIDLQAYNHALAAAALKAKSTEDFLAALNAEWEQVIAPLIQAAMSSQDDNVIQCAIYHALAYERQLQLLGADPDNVIGSAIVDFINDGRHILIEHAKKRCTEDRDFTALMDLLSVLRQDQLFGGIETIPDYSQLESQCPYQLQFDFTSLILSHYPGVGYFKMQVSTKFPLNGKWDKTVLTSVTDPAVDLFAAYELSNSGKATYDIWTFEGDPDYDCTIVASGLRPGTFDVIPEQPGGKKSQVQFMFSAGYDPTPYSQSGVQLCAFCPVYRKKLQKVDVLMNPGLNWEDLTNTCPLIGPQKITNLFWNGGWDSLHLMDPTSGHYFFPNWDLVVSQDVLAQLQSLKSVTTPEASSVESTVMRLNRVAPPPPK